MNLDIGNALAAVADRGLEESELRSLDERVADAHDRIQRGRDRDEFGYAALNLPTTTDPGALRERVGSLTDCETVLTVGIGGSALGAATLTTALGVGGDHFVLDNVDPAETAAVLDTIRFERTALNVVSRSGTTAETLANFLVVREAFEDAGVDWTDRTIVTTGDEGPLHDLAAERGLPTCDVPEGVPGRFSALSAVGLVPAALLGADIEGVLSGGADAAHTLRGSLFECPAYAYGAVAHALADEGTPMNVLMPYAERLEPFAEWFAQLWAESLGKDGQGQTPVRALGATDQHSQLQLYRAGPRDKLVTFVRPTTRDEVTIPATDLDGLSYLGATDMGAVLDAEFRATEASLAAAGRPNVRIEIDRLDAAGIGDLLYSMEAACILAGELAGVETFTQPAVEWGKRAASGLLGGGDFEEAQAVAAKHEHRIEE